MLLQLTFVLGNYGRVDRQRLLKVHPQTGAAADRKVNGTGSLWRVWAIKQRAQVTVAATTKKEEPALIHIQYHNRTKYKYNRALVASRAEGGGVLKDSREQMVLMKLQ